uniref:C3H1-type domain-containing protein n=1 Tax=Kalanchoe fedtschenkoi TaxID=63787 RepID=A0A7N0T1J1_KALFE
MFGQGNPAPYPGASLQQCPPGAPQPFQNGGQGPGHPMLQHFNNQSGTPVYQTVPMIPPPHVQQVPLGGMPNLRSYVHAPQAHVGSNQMAYHYPPGLPNSQHRPQFGVQNLYHALPPRSSLPPPPPRPPASHGLQHPDLFLPPPPPPLPSVNIVYRSVGQPTPPTDHQGFSHIQPPPPPPPASFIQTNANSESSSLSTPNDSHFLFTDHPPPPSLPSSPPSLPSSPPHCPPVLPPSGLPGSDVKELASAVVTVTSLSVPSSNECRDPINSNGGDADNERTHTHCNYDSSLNVDRRYDEGEACPSMVDDSSANEYKSVLLGPKAASSSQFDSSTSPGGLCSSIDSDMDVEDCITNLVEDLETNDLPKVQNLEALTQNGKLDSKEQFHGQILSPESSSGMPGEGIHGDDLLGQPSKTESPIKLLQGYASDDTTDKPCAENVGDVSSIPPASDESAILKKDGDSNHFIDGGCSQHCTTDEGLNPISPQNSLMKNRVRAFVKESAMDLKKSCSTSVAEGKAAVQTKGDTKEEFLDDEFLHSSLVNNRSKSGDMASKRGKCHKEDSTTPAQLKFDEFGRLARDDASDSDSDDLRYSRKQVRRGRSRSISPFDRRRRSPLRRRNNRSRSRSWSPLKRRSRSRSPVYRRVNDSERTRRDKIQTSVCFNFRNGRCRRGSSCRFLHHDSDWSGSTNFYKSKHHHSGAAHGSNESDIQDIFKRPLEEMESRGYDKVKSHDSQQLKSSQIVHSDSLRNNVTDENEVRREHALLGQDGHTKVADFNNCEDIVGETTPSVDAPVAQVAHGQDATNLPGNDRYRSSTQTCHPRDGSSLQIQVSSSGVMSSKDQTVANQSGPQPQTMNISNASVSIPIQSLGTSHQHITSNPQLDSIPSSSQSYAVLGPGSQSILPEKPSLQLPCSINVTPFSQVTAGLFVPQLQRNFSLMQPSMSLPPPLTPGGGPPLNPFSLSNQAHQSNIQPNPSWTAYPPPPPRPSVYLNIPSANASTSGQSIPSQFEHNHQPQRTGFGFQNISGPYSGHLHYNSQCGGFQHQNYYPSHEVHGPPLAIPVRRPNSLFTGNSQSQQIEGPQLGRNDQTFVQGFIPSNSHVQPNTSLTGPPAMKVLPSSEAAYELSSKNSNILIDTSLNDLRNSIAGDSSSNISGKLKLNSARTSAANLDVSGIPNFGRSRTSVHYNLYGPTFDRPLASILSQPQVLGQVEEGHGLRETSYSASSFRNAGQNFPGSGGGQYDPLLDSIEKCPNSFVNSERVKKQRSTSDSDNMLRHSVSRKPIDVEETNRKKESEAIASLTSSENGEFGETADVEIGMVENESFSNPVNMPDGDSEVEVSGRSPAKSKKKRKDSRSMKLFKCAIANFVKDVLKPSWRQGNMSKEAFKTIVKKTVDKVSGAMKGHRYPKSQAKINHYIDSSQRKLTKLVMGYVDKYVNV